MVEIDLLAKYPKAKRDLEGRAQVKEENRKIARQFGREFFDGNRDQGYGGFNYHSRFWTDVVQDMITHFKLSNSSSLLDVGCAKGFMLHDLKQALPKMVVAGVDISSYAVENAMEDVKPFLKVADAKKLPFADNSFDLVIAINTIHNLEEAECFQAVKEIERVSRGKGFITVDAYRNEEEKKRMFMWNLTAKTIKSVEAWQKFYKEAGYNGDYYWFIP
ncbi:class I SAM-dependent methyltransferase [Candidatus Margulisiibacteriota bacterium]